MKFRYPNQERGPSKQGVRLGPYFGVGDNLVTLGTGAASPYSQEAQVYFAAMSVQPDDTRKGILDTFIRALKTAGVWALIDILYLTAAHDAQAARLNLKDPASFTLIPSATAPTFTVDRGFTGNGTTSYHDTQYNPAAGYSQATQGLHHIGVWAGTDASTSNADGGNTTLSIASRNGTLAVGRSARNSSDSIDLGLTTAIGWTCLTRSNNSNFQIVRNLDAPGSFTRSVTSYGGGSLYVGARNDSGVAAAFSVRRIQMFHAGNSLTDAQKDAFYEAAADYMSAIGAYGADLDQMWIGDNTDTSVRVSAKFSQDTATGARLVVSTAEALTSPIYSSLVASSGRRVQMQVTGLTANTQYYVGVESDGLVRALRGKFKTSPAALGSPASYSFWFASCELEGRNALIFDGIRARNALFGQHLGDLHYENNSINSVNRFYQSYDTVFSASRLHQLFRETPGNYMLNDHDAQGNGSYKDGIARPAWITAYRDWVPHPTLWLSGSGDSLGYDYSHGRVRFVVPDLISDSENPASADGPTHYQMGVTQEAAFKAAILAAKTAGQVVCWFASYPPGGSFAVEATRIWDWLIAQNMHHRVFICDGDKHWLGINSDTDWSTSQTAPIPEFQASPLFQENRTPSASDWDQGTSIASQSQYGVVDIADNGTDIAVTWTGYSVDVDTGVETARVSYSFVLTP